MERQNLRLSWLKSSDLSESFDILAVQIESWHIIFEMFFPAYGTPTYDRKRQNFPNAIYYREWKALLQRINAQERDQVMSAMRTEFNKLLWLPKPSVERMWDTRASTNKKAVRYPKLNQGEVAYPCPVVVLNKWAYPNTNLIVGRIRKRRRLD